jgi:PAS domain-containing protein/DNA-binding CsgD family transcriptional regulator
MDDRERLIDLIYEGVTNEEVWKELRAWLVDGLNATGAGLGFQDMAMPAFYVVAAAGMYQGLRAVWRDRERLLADLGVDRQILDETDEAVLLLDAELQVIYANRAAATLLDGGEGLGLRHRCLVARHPDDDTGLQAVLRSAPRIGQRGAPETFAVVRRPEHRPLLVNATPLAPHRTNGPPPGAAWVVRISDPERGRRPDPAVLQRLFGLTQAEAAVVMEMLPPRSENEAARRRGVAKSTFRAQLHAAYSKLGVNGRDELVYVLAGYGFR